MFKCQTHANISNFSWGFTSNGIGITTEMLISQASWKGSHFVLLNTRSNSATGQRQMRRSFSSQSGAQRLDTETDHGWICWFPVYWLVKIKYSYYGFVHIILNKPVRLTTPPNSSLTHQQNTGLPSILPRLISVWRPTEQRPDDTAIAPGTGAFRWSV